MSLHRYDNGGFFPASDDANFVKSGSGKGEGFNINIPWNDVSIQQNKCNFLADINSQSNVLAFIFHVLSFFFFPVQMRMGDAEYIAAFHQIILPIAYEYNPEIVLVSCGFDAGVGDPLVSHIV